ncbi:hypothetical protein [Streptomyces sp. NPDC002547]
MLVSYKQEDGSWERLSTDELSAIEAAAIEEATGNPWRRIEDQLRAQDPTAMRSIVWAFRRREQPDLEFAAFDVPGWRRRLKARLERAEIEDFFDGLIAEALNKSEDASIDAMLPHVRKLAHDQADVDAALDALGKGHLAAARADSAA